MVFAGDKEMGRITQEEDLVDLNTQAVEKFELDCFLVTPNQEVWVGCRTRGIIRIFNAENLKFKMSVGITCKGISSMVRVKDKVRHFQNG